MTRNLTCDCGSSFTIDGSATGDDVVCPVCGRQVNVASQGGPREFVTLWVPENVVRERVQVDALSHFVAAVERVVRRELEAAARKPLAPGEVELADLEQGELDVACALLPNGRLLLDIQFHPPELADRFQKSLEEQLSGLRCPPVRSLPVTFSFRKRLGRTTRGLHGFHVPFLRMAGDWQGDSLDDLVLAAAVRVGLWDDNRATGGAARSSGSPAIDFRMVHPAEALASGAAASPDVAEAGAMRDFMGSGGVEPSGTPQDGDTDAKSGDSLASDPSSGSEADPTPSPGTTMRRAPRRRRFGDWLMKLRDWLARRRSSASASAETAAASGGGQDSSSPTHAGQTPSNDSAEADSSLNGELDDVSSDSVRVDTAALAASVAASRTPAHKSADEDDLPTTAPPESARSDDFTLDQVSRLISRFPEDARYFRWRAELYQRAGDLSAAIADYSESLKRRPGDLEALLARGAAYCVADDTRHGLADFNEVLNRHPSHVAARFNRGLVYLELDACEAAIEDFSAAIAGDPWNSKLFLSRGRARALLKQYDDALADIDSAIKLDPNADEPYVLRGALQRFVRPIPECTKQAISDFSRAIEIDPEQPLYYLQRAEHFWAVDEYERALADCNRALELKPDLAVGLGLRGAVHLGLDRYQEAIDDCSRAIEGGHSGVQVFLSRSEAFQSLEDFDSALSDADRAIELAPHLSAAWKCRSLVRARLGMTEQAIEDMNEAVRLDPDQAVLYCHRAALHRHLGRTKSALRDCDRAVRLAADFAPSYLIRAGCWEDLEQRDKAAADFDRLVELSTDPDEAAQARAERGNFWMRWDDFERARVDFDFVISHHPDHFMALFHRGQILAALGKFDEALGDLNAVIRIAPTFSPALARRAHVWLAKEEIEKADADYAEAIRLDPSSAEQLQVMRLLDEAHLRLKRCEFDDAIRLATEAIEATDENAPAYHVRANAYWYSEQYVEAAADYDKLLEIVDDTAAIYASRGQVLAELGEFDEAVRDLDRAMKMGSDRQPPRQLAYALNG
ncbi:MAG TPA: tetratricopeptide repeat protein, partial [Pirellulaceae bacterium]|nr:tetratricopeptide repeat protein [Pirellulaceae bacterium]